MRFPDWMRPGYLAAGAVLAAVVCRLVPAEGPVSTAVEALFLTGFLAYGLRSMRDLLDVVGETGRDIRGWWRDRTARPLPPEPLPELPEPAQAAARHAVATMAMHGLFRPEVPDAALLFGVLARNGWGTGPGSIVLALHGAAVRAGIDPARWMGNLLVEDTHAEQFDDALTRQVEDVVQLAGGALRVDQLAVTVDEVAGQPDLCGVRLRMRVQGERVALAWRGDIKQLSTHLQHALAVRLAATGSGRRLAWLDMGELLVLSVLDDGAVEALNTALQLGPQSPCHWAWVDAVPPQSAA